MKALIVEDDVNIRQGLVEVLQGEGYRTVEAGKHFREAGTKAVGGGAAEPISLAQRQHASAASAKPGGPTWECVSPYRALVAPPGATLRRSENAQ